MKRDSRIMVVDDDPAMRVTLEGIIEDEGYDVVGAEDGYRVIELAGEMHFDLIFMDIKMPGIDGVETQREIRRISPESVVVIMTGYSVESLVKEALAQRAYAVIYKPFDIHQIMDIMHSVLNTGLVLVVGDRLEDRQTLRAILEEEGLQVAEAQDGKQAVSMAAEKHYRAILMDVKMPGMDGFTACEEIRKFDPDVKVIFVTGYALEDSVREALQSGAYSALTKPVNPDEMLALLKSVSKPKGES